ncbi:MAG: flagellar hook-basal body complex protein FliE [Spirochaetaceae bacterium]|jgi:flagellar hook-basal body complex protein FliE|nr:flagellar hook-basal body complex protein FliE [Spirochaetaceae bacterium]
MSIFNTDMVRGDFFQLNRSSTLHLDENGDFGSPVIPESGKDFGSLLMGKLDEVSNAQGEVNRLSELMLTNPDAVDVDDITVAMAEAEMTIGLTKAVVDKAVQAYKDIVNMR